MPESLAGKVVVITGSTRGIGRAMAEACANAGAIVVVSSRTAAAVTETVAALDSGATVSGAVCDVSRLDDLEALYKHAVSAHGGIDVWVNNAGISPGMRMHVDTLVEEITETVAVNLVGTMLASRLVVPYFIQRGGGVLINVSGRGARGGAAAYTAVYAATKAGVMVFTKSLAEEHARDPISILVFMPGMIDTDFYGEDMPVSPGLEPLATNIRVVLDCIGTPIEDVGPAIVAAACTAPGTGTGKVHKAGSGVRSSVGGFKLAWARITGRMKSL